jgi:hypothetical protein
MSVLHRHSGNSFDQNLLSGIARPWYYHGFGLLIMRDLRQLRTLLVKHGPLRNFCFSASHADNLTDVWHPDSLIDVWHPHNLTDVWHPDNLTDVWHPDNLTDIWHPDNLTDVSHPDSLTIMSVLRRHSGNLFDRNLPSNIAHLWYSHGFGLLIIGTLGNLGHYW